MNEEQLAKATEGCIEHRDVNVRQVGNGFVLAGNRRFMEPSTSAVRASLTVEAVAASAEDAADAVAGFLANGKF